MSVVAAQYAAGAVLAIEAIILLCGAFAFAEQGQPSKGVFPAVIAAMFGALAGKLLGVY